MPGLAKTLTVRTLAETIATTFQRIQFTPDLLPADVLGTQVYDQATGQFAVKKGPIFANIILADEINRAPAKVQAALLEAMQEKQVTIGGTTFTLDEPFLVLATQNPIEQEGTYPLPEAQVDRFMLKLRVGYPSARRGEGDHAPHGRAASRSPWSRWPAPQAILEARRRIAELYMDDRIVDYIVDIVHATREPAAAGLPDLAPLIEFGASPRATIALAQASRAHAFLRGRAFVTPDDVKAIAPDVLRHRVLTTYEAEAEEVDDRRDRAPGARRAMRDVRDRGVAPAHRAHRRPPDVLRQVRLIELRTRGLVNSLFAGEYRSVFKGQGMEFAEVREYQPGDEVRTIDWNVTARMRRPYVKRYVEERELTVMLAVDLSGSERFGTRAPVQERGGRRSWPRCSRCRPSATTTAWARCSSPIASSTSCRRARDGATPCASLRDLLVFRARGARHRPRAAPSTISTKMLAHTAIVFVVSDFLGADVERPLKLLAQRHDVVAVTLEDPGERGAARRRARAARRSRNGGDARRGHERPGACAPPTADAGARRARTAAAAAPAAGHRRGARAHRVAHHRAAAPVLPGARDARPEAVACAPRRSCCCWALPTARRGGHRRPSRRPRP